ncbi:hypothetical protein PENSPDRAFT_584939 [Peniophora sp. CONT]|nr:hypothetical protein PENSPDRAFT_584939 [Peniophora sp. CONT]
MNGTLVGASPVGSEKVLRHHEYYISGGDVVFRVGNFLFRVHRYFFTRESAYFRERLPQATSPGDFTKGSNDSHPYVLEDATSEDFARFLWIFYNPKYSVYRANVETWLSILKLAHIWQFPEVRALALRSVEEHELDPIRKIVFYHTYEVDRDLLTPSYLALVTREEPITLDEGLELGIETALMIARAREVARSPSTGIKKGHARMASSPVTVPQSDLESIIKELFRTLSANPSTTLPASAEPASGRSTPTKPTTATGFRSGGEVCMTPRVPAPLTILNTYPGPQTPGAGPQSPGPNGNGNAPTTNGNGASILGSANGSVFGTPKNGTGAGRGTK